jgi:hypothetical protein
MRRRFAFRLCLVTREIHPDILLAKLSHRQFNEWIRYFELEPWGEERADLRMARQVWAQLQPHSKKKLKEHDYMFQFDQRRKEKPKTPQDYQNKARRAYLGCGGVVPPRHVKGDVG